MGDMSVAKIVKSDEAPEGTLRFSFGTTSCVLDERTKAVETEDATLLADAAAHPHLNVVYEDQPIKTPAVNQGKPQTAPVITETPVTTSTVNGKKY